MKWKGWRHLLAFGTPLSFQLARCSQELQIKKSTLRQRRAVFCSKNIFILHLVKGIHLGLSGQDCFANKPYPVNIFMRSNFYGPFYDPKLYLSNILQLCAGFAEKGRSHLDSSCQDPFGSLPSPTCFPAFAGWPFTPLTVHCKLRSVVIVILWNFCLLGTDEFLEKIQTAFDPPHPPLIFGKFW